MTCLLCSAEDASHVLEVASLPGDKVAFPSSTQIGAECLRLLLAEPDGDLEARLTVAYNEFGGVALVTRI